MRNKRSAVRRLGTLVLPAVATLLLARGLALGGDKPGEAGFNAIGDALVPIVSMHDMKGHQWGISLSPNYWSDNTIEMDNNCCAPNGGPINSNGFTNYSINGYGGALALKMEVTPHWGLQAFGAQEYQSGTYNFGSNSSGFAPQAAYNDTPGGAGLPGGTLSDVHSSAYGLMATYDPFSNDKGFRMPISLGAGDMSQAFNFDNSYINPNNSLPQDETVRFRRSFPVVTGGISFDFLFFNRVRVMPGVFVLQGSLPQQVAFAYNVDQNGTTYSYTTTEALTHATGEVYTTILYRPLNLAYTFDIIPTRFLMSLQYTKEWAWGRARANAGEPATSTGAENKNGGPAQP